jgi:PAS domain S-box-containing protein
MKADVRRTPSTDWRVPLLITSLLAALLCVAYPLNWLESLEMRLTDLRFALRGERPSSQAIAIVVIDDAAVNRYPDLPTDPALHAELIRRLTAAKVAAIGLDIPQLARPLTDAGVRPDGKPTPFRELAAAVGASGRVVLPTVVAATQDVGPGRPPEPVRRFAAGPGKLPTPVQLRDSRLIYPRAELCASAGGLGSLTVYPDRDWTVREIPLLVDVAGTLYPSLALELARVALGAAPGVYERREDGSVTLGSLAIPADEAGEMVINFAGPPDTTYPTFPYEDLVRGDGLDPDLAAVLSGRIVLVGSTAAAVPSRLRTPLSPYMAGVEVNANAVDTILARRFLPRPTTGEAILLTVAGSLAAMLVGWRLQPWRAGVVLALLLAGTVAGWSALFAAGICLPMAGPILAVLIGGLVLTGQAAAASYLERKRSADLMASRIGALAGVGRLLHSGLDRQQLLREIMVWVGTEIGCEAASLVLLQEEEQRLKFEVALGPKGDQLRDVTLEVGQGIVGTVVQNGEPLLVPDTEKEPRFAKEIAQAVGFPARSILCVPMRTRARVIGAIEVINKRDGTLFSEQDISLLTVIAQHAAMFLEIAELYGVLERRVDLANKELRSANQELSTEKAKIEAIINRMADGVIAADSQGRLVLVNDAAEKMLGLSENDSIGKPVGEGLANPDVAHMLAADQQATEDARELALGDPVQRVVRARSARVADEQGLAGRVVVLTDITDLRELDRTKTDMVSFVSHELKNPLATIKGFAGLIRERAPDPSQQEHAELIGRQAGRMTRMIEDFLNIARIDMGRELDINCQPIDDPRATIGEAIAAESQGRPDHRFAVRVDPSTPAFRADPDKLYQILVNLINNAVKYSPDGGTVTVELGPENRDQVRFSVRDEGIGLSPEHMRHLFKRFRRVPDGSGSRVEGTGLGLFLTRRLVQAHGGRIWAESTPRAGSTFHFVLPVNCGANDEQGPAHQSR